MMRGNDFLSIPVHEMRDDVIDLISDADDSDEERKEWKQKPFLLSKDQKQESTLGRDDPYLRVKVEVQEHISCKEVDTARKLIGSRPVRDVLQGKQIIRQFWKAGDYDGNPSRAETLPNGMDHVRVHPKFLHSNATSHKWALGAIAELLDNAIDEVSNGATFVSVDKVMNCLDNSPALLVQDDGGGMDPENMRHCMSLGYSRKASNMTIGQYGNGFKTSTMRLGADVIVFSRCSRDSSITQSVGLLSYTFLRATGHEDIVVPMIDFEVVNGKPKMLVRSTPDDWLKNLSTILQWSPYADEIDLMNQFNDIGPHGTKIIVYNLWMNDDGDLELDFDTDKQDIQVRGTSKADKSDTLQKQLTNNHIANRLRFSLRAYASILYMKMPENFQIILRGRVVEHLSIVDDLKFPQRIMYKPQIGNAKDYGYKEVSVITTIGFAKEAPMISVHGFNVYHKNRLIMPFWKVFQDSSSRGRGVVGVLEANFMEPAHDKQDFEKTPILQRLETRLKQMTVEYWNLHCNLIGYQGPKQSIKQRVTSQSSAEVLGTNRLEENGVSHLRNDGLSRLGESSAPLTPPLPGTNGMIIQTESQNTGEKRFIAKENGTIVVGSVGNSLSNKRTTDSTDHTEPAKRQKISLNSQQAFLFTGKGTSIMKLEDILYENEQLKARCKDYEAQEQLLKSKIEQLDAELQSWKNKYRSLFEVKDPVRKIPKEETV